MSTALTIVLSLTILKRAYLKDTGDRISVVIPGDSLYSELLLALQAVHVYVILSDTLINRHLRAT